jgi:predicted phosphodiesterase
MSMTIIGDVHGHYDRYVKMARKRDFTAQIGDLGFKYDCLRELDPENHKFVGGNHDNYDIIGKWPHYLGDYGMASLGGVDFFFYRGAYSIDRQHRIVGVSWWEAEQLKIEDFMKAIEIYREAKPEIVLTHDCPESIGLALLPPGEQVYQNTTSWALQELFQIHQPRAWVHGHWHVSRRIQRDGTEFICLDELEPLEIG